VGRGSSASESFDFRVEVSLFDAFYLKEDRRNSD